MRAMSVPAALLALVLAGTAGTAGTAASGRLAGPGSAPAPPPTVGGCPAFPADSWWNADISALPQDARGRAWLAHMQTTRRLHPDFGPSGGAVGYGIPITLVDGAHPRVPVTFTYADESDPVGYPLGDDTRIEGGAGSPGDKHAVVIDTTACRLYETWLTEQGPSGWTAGSGATWDLTSNALRPRGWTSADAAGLPILPGLLRYDEVAAGHVDHAIRFTTDRTAAAHVWPARHDAGSGSATTYPPMGARFRLRKGWVPPASLGAEARVVVRALKHYGLVLADNGSPWFFQGEEDPRWPDALIADLKRIPAAAFVAVDTRSLKVFTDSMQTH